MPEPVVTELIVDSRKSVEGGKQFEQAMAKAGDAAEKAQGIMLATGQSAGKLGAALDRLKAQTDPLYAANQKLEKSLGTLDAAYRKGIVTESEAASIHTKLIAIRDKSTASLVKEGVAAEKTAEGMRLLKEVSIGFVSGIGAGVLLGGITELPTAIAEAVDRLGNIGNKADTIGITTKALQELRYAARLSDVEIGTLDDAMQKFSINLGKPGSPLQKQFSANGKLISGDVLKDLETYADLIKNASNQEQRNILVTTAFGKSAAEMGRLFDDGSKGIAAWGREAEAAGAVLSDDKIQRARDLNDQMERLKPQIEAAQTEFALLIAPAEVAVLQSFNDALRQTVALFTAINNMDLKKIAAIIGRDDGTHPSLFGKNGLIQFDWFGTGAARANNITVNGGNNVPGSAFGGGWGSSGFVDPSKPPATKVFDTAAAAAADAAAKAAERLKKSYDDLILTTQQKIDQSLRERASIGLTADAALKLKNEQDLLQDAQKKGIDLDAMTADGTRTKREELIAYADKLTATTIETKKLQAAQEAAQEVWKTLGDTIGEVFDGGIKSFDEFVDHLLSGFAKIGEQNFAKLFSGDSFNALFGNITGGAANDNKKNGGWTSVFDAIKGGAKEGTSEGATSGLDSWFKSMGGKGGTAGMISAGAGGLGLGYTSQNPLLGALGGAASGFMAGGWIGAAIGGIAGVIGGFLGMNEAAAKASAELDKARDSIEQFIDVGLGKEFSQYESALAQFTAQGKEFIEVAKAAGDSDLAGKIQDAINAYPATLQKQLLDDLDRQLNAAQGKDYLNDIADAQKAYNQTLADGALLGIDVSAKANDILAASLKKIATDANLTAAQILVLAAQFPALAGSLNALIGVTGGQNLDQLQQNVDDAQSKLRDAYNEQASLFKSTGDAARSAAKNIRDYLASLKTGPNSGLSPFDQLQAAQAQFAQVSQGALAGNKDDLDKLTGVSQDYLDAAKSYYASSTAYFQILDSVEAILNQTATTQDSVASTADMQLAALNQQVGSLISIDNGVKSVADAIAALAAAQGALAAGQAANQNGATPTSAIDTLYQTVLGRPADAAGEAYWTSQVAAAGGTLTPDITRAFIAAGIANGETVDPTIRAAYGYASGTSFHPGGWAWVGEQGPELMRLPRGAQVMPNAASMRMAGAGNDNSALLAEVRRLNATVDRLLRANIEGDVANVQATQQVGMVGAEMGRQQKLDGVRKTPRAA